MSSTRSDTDQAVENFRKVFVERNSTKFALVKDAFRMLDEDKNGCLDRQELDRALEIMNM